MTRGGEDIDLDEALDSLLGRTRTGDPHVDALEAMRAAMDRRRQNSEAGGLVVAYLRSEGMTYRAIEEETGIPIGTAHRWANPPGKET